MYQESDDKLRGSAGSDTFILIMLIAIFFIAGAIAAFLRAKFDSPLPMYIAGVVFAGILYLVYRLRLVGWRYTVFYEEPKPEYDPRFDEEIIHEDYPYPVGTVVIERIVSAKGEIAAVIDSSEISAILEPGASAECGEELVFGPRKKEKSSSLLVTRDGKTTRIYFTPSERFLSYVRGLTEGK